MNAKEIFAITLNDFMKFGCPYCGAIGIIPLTKKGDSALVTCRNCASDYILNKEYKEYSDISLKIENETITPQTNKHPIGERLDIKPKNGEFFEFLQEGIAQGECSCLKCGKEINAFSYFCMARMQSLNSLNRICKKMNLHKKGIKYYGEILILTLCENDLISFKSLTNSTLNTGILKEEDMKRYANM